MVVIVVAWLGACGDGSGGGVALAELVAAGGQQNLHEQSGVLRAHVQQLRADTQCRHAGIVGGPSCFWVLGLAWGSFQDFGLWVWRAGQRSMQPPVRLMGSRSRSTRKSGSEPQVMGSGCELLAPVGLNPEP